MNHIPDDLTELTRWVCWKYVSRTGGGKPTKIPYRINGQPASSTDPATWTTHEDVVTAFETGQFDGIGFVFVAADGFIGIDIDHCLDEHGKLKREAVPVLDLFPDTYTEISPSQRGLKLFIKGKMPGDGSAVAFPLGGGVNIEIYGEKRYFTVTGDAWGGYCDIEEHQTGLDALIAQSPHGQRKIGQNIATAPGQKIPKGQQHDSLVSTGGTMWRRGASTESIFQALWAINNNQCIEPGTEAAIRRIAESFARYDRPKVIPITRALPAPAPPSPPDEPPAGLFVIQAPEPDETVELLTQTRTDDGNAERLLAVHGKDILYCPPMKKWLIWDTQRWVVDETNRIQELARDTARQFLHQVETRVEGDKDLWKFANKSLNIAGITAMVKLASSERTIMPLFLDAQPYLLNCLNGTVDLRTSAIQPHNREDYITKLVHYDYNPTALCPQWLKFLDWVMSGAGEEDSPERTQRFTSYLQRAFGYSCTGVTSEKAFFILYGESGDNGKTTMSNTVHHVLQEYATSVNIESLMTGHQAESTNAQSDLADLRGARFVQTSEAQRGQKLDQSKLKKLLAGGGTFKTCRKYENVITIDQTWHIWMDTNPLPIIRDPDDQATMARLHPIPCLNKVADADKDFELPNKLISEAEGILAWMIEGARDWFENGLQKPAEVIAAREEWRESQDQLGRFVAERCDKIPGEEAPAGDMYTRYKYWTLVAGEKDVLSANDFGLRMQKLYTMKHRNKGNFYLGIKLRS